MKTWKIKNNANESIKFACKTNDGSRGIMLQPNQFCVIEAQQTAFIEAQERRGFISVNREFDNSKYELELAVPYSEEKLKILESKNSEKKSKIKIAEENAKKYINKQ